MTLHLHRAERADALADGLADLLAEPPADPFAIELVVVSAVGLERWLSQRLSHRLGARDGTDDGVATGLRFARPQSIVAELLGVDDQDPWRPEALMWTVLAALEDSFDEPWLSAVAAHLGRGLPGREQELRRDRRLGVARQLAERFARYARQRPTMTQSWTAGRDEDGSGRALSADLRWQPQLWRRVRSVLDAPSPDERIASVISALSQQPAALDLPDRLSLFGHSRLPWGELQVLAALARVRDVHLWLPHPSPAAWRELSDADAIIARDLDTSARRVRNRLLASLGRDVRELQRSLTALAADAVVHEPIAAERRPTLLGRLQADVAADRPGEQDGPLDPSIQVHACHGRTRQVEVLRDVLVGLLQDDPTLELRDIVVMVPDIESYAPLFWAAFGHGEVLGESEGHPGRRLRLQMADRAAAHANPLLAVLLRLLELARDGRVTSAELLDLLGAEPIRRRFTLDDEALSRLTQWVDATGIRWGLSAEHRSRFGLALEQNTWRSGLDRIAAGVVAAEDPARPVGQVLPLDDMPSGDVDLAGRLTVFVTAIETALREFEQPATMACWTGRLRAALDALTAVDDRDAWQRHQAEGELGRLDDDATVVQLGEVLALLRDRWAARPSRVGFRTGSLTVCTMTPMRSVPHRVVALVGLDDGVFPRSGRADGDDVLARRPLTGERDARAEDRQLLLDAVMSATETLVITYSGADEHRGHSQPPAVPLGELIDQVRRTAGGRDPVIDHRLQPFDPDNLRPGAITSDGRPFSFDPAALAGARAALRPRPQPEPLLAAPLPDAPEAQIDLDRLAGFVQNPIRAFWRQRLDVALPGEDVLLAEDLPLSLDGLARWRIGQRLLDDAVRGVDPQDAWAAIWRSGMLPPGRLGAAVAESVAARVGALVDKTTELRVGEADVVDVDVALDDGRRLVGAVDGVHEGRVVTVSYSTIRGPRRLRDWVRLLALALARPDVAWVAHTAGVIGRGTGQLITGPAPDRATAARLLGDLIDLRDAGLRRPLPLPVDIALLYAEQLRRRGPDAAARIAGDAWRRGPGRFGPPPIRDAVEIVRVWGSQAPFEALLNDGFAQLAPRLWEGALDHQREAAL